MLLIFGMLILCPNTLLNFLIRSKVLPWSLFGLLCKECNFDGKIDSGTRLSEYRDVQIMHQRFDCMD